MATKSKAVNLRLFLSLCVFFIAVPSVLGQEYYSLKGLKSVRAVFDVRIANPKSAALHLNLIHQTFKHKNITSVTKKPDFVVIFSGPSVKLISKNREGFSPEEHKALDEISGTISEMSKDGIKLEICLFAARVFGVSPASILPGIKHVGNGWISLIGYQSAGYALVPAY
jgi:intracellular sulfur oxidation DsrE/DsrF family protein